MPSDKKILIIRFSSFGDIVQSMSIIPGIKKEWKDCELHWLTKNNSKELLQLNPLIDHVHSFDSKNGLLGLIRLALDLRKKNFNYIYDAHNNLRSKIVLFFLTFMNFSLVKTSRSKERWRRILLFKFGKNTFPKPYRGMISYIKPLEKFGLKFACEVQKWNFSTETLKGFELPPEYICFAPSAAWPMKRWPLEHWKDLAGKLENKNIVILGGPEDHFCQELEDLFKGRVYNFAGKLSLVQSCAVVSSCEFLISADTGLIHVADILGVRGFSLIGPTAFGFPTNENIKTIEVDLPCRPCSKDGRGKCSQDIYQKCMTEIKPDFVKSEFIEAMGNSLK